MTTTQGLATTPRSFEAEHLVKFYETVPQLANTVLNYVGEGLRSGDGVIIITTPDHQEVFRQGLSLRGVETEALSKSGRLRFFDASETLGRFCGDLPDPVEFRRVVGAALDAVEAASPSRRVRVYGEMVAVLCRTGQSEAALALEDLWNELLSDRPFQLLCAYALADFPRAADGETILSVCQRHGHVESATAAESLGDAEQLARRLAVLEQQAQALNAEMGERRRVERELLQARKMEAVGRLAGGIAHEFNNLLTVISGYTELLLSMQSFGPGERSSLQEVDRAAKKASAMTRKLVAVSSQQVMDDSVINLCDTVRGLASMLTGVCGERVRLELVLDDEAGSILADASQIEHVLLNFVVNARDAIYSQGDLDGVGGHITVTTSWMDVDETADMSALLLAPGRYAVLEVRDDGPGIAPDALDLVFDPFYTTKNKSVGSGLGLATVFGIVKQCGGRVYAESRLGEGTAFRAAFPCVSALSEVDERGDSVERLQSSRELTVLLVEDEPSVRALVESELRRSNFRVLSAPDAETALALASETPVIDVLVTDVVMPGQTGPRLAETLASRHPDLAVIFMSGYAEALLDEPVKGVARSSFLSKPFSPKSLSERITELC